MSFIADVWSGLQQQVWWIRFAIGAIAGGFLFVVIPAIVAPKPLPGQGGAGGSAHVGGSGMAIGGRGGGGGPGGAGGAGGGGSVAGDGVVIGGDGGEAGQVDRGGRGGMSPLQRMGVPNEKLPDGTWLWDRGRGGDGGNPSR